MVVVVVVVDRKITFKNRPAFGTVRTALSCLCYGAMTNKIYTFALPFIDEQFCTVKFTSFMAQNGR